MTDVMSQRMNASVRSSSTASRMPGSSAARVRSAGSHDPLRRRTGSRSPRRSQGLGDGVDLARGRAKRPP